MDNHQISNNLAPVVLIRGMLGECRYWEYFKQLVEQRLQRPVFLLSLAKSGTSLEPLSLVTLIEQHREQLCQLTGQGDCHLVSLSLGASVALCWQQMYPDEVKSCTLINPLVTVKQRRWQPLLWWLLFKIMVFSRWPGDQQTRWLHRLSAWPSLHSQLATSETHSIDFKALTQHLYEMPIAEPMVPLQLLVSRHDKWISSEVSYQLADIWQAPLFPHLSAGHDLPLDDPRWVCEKLTDWITHYD
ncbi:alpha/beta fold hydrolase [Celerinatantimonas yamalensis]|uniref:Alpha/beta hydrolase n=1 Tax=Celerinatantimonas yamalensis TaxID=559956 RepID=A0ABW9G9N5_9GAMM